MKKSLIAMAAMLAFGVAQAEYIGAGSYNSNGVKSSSIAAASSSGNGLSISAAGNSQTSSSSSDASASKYSLGGTYVGSRGGLVTTDGSTSGTTASFAGNLSVGNATGFAGAKGTSNAVSGGFAYFDQHGDRPEASTAGDSLSRAESGAMSGRNGAAVAGGANVGAYATVAGANQVYFFGGSKNDAKTGVLATNASLSNQGAIGNAGAYTNVWGDTGGMGFATSGKVVSGQPQ